MKCDEFETRLHEALDARASLAADPQLAHHARECAACRETLNLYDALLVGLDARVSPEPSEEFAAAVLNRLAARPRSPRKVLTAAAGLAVAAALLIAVGPRLFPPADPAAPTVPPHEVKIVDSPRDPARGVERLAATRESRERYLSMIRLTGEAMATLPNRVRRVAMPSGNSPVAPLTDSFEAAFDALRRALPGKGGPAGGESQS